MLSYGKWPFAVRNDFRGAFGSGKVGFAVRNVRSICFRSGNGPLPYTTGPDSAPQSLSPHAVQKTGSFLYASHLRTCPVQKTGHFMHGRTLPARAAQKKPGMPFDIPGFRLKLKRQADATAILVVLAEVRLRTILRSFRPLRILRTLSTALGSFRHILGSGMPSGFKL